MRVKFSVFIIFALFFLVVSCNRENKRYKSFGVNLNASGFLNDGVENGVFEFYNSEGTRMSAGSYENGLRSGEWFYNVKGNLVSIEWGEFHDSILNFRTNVPRIGD